MQNKLRIVTVTYNSSDVIGAFLDSVPKGLEVVVVDNASTDDTRQIVMSSPARLIELPQNRGFGTACNAGAGTGTEPFVFFVNPDAQLTENCCEILLEAAENHPKAGAINPAILDDNGRIRLNRRSALIPRSEWTDRRLASADQLTSAEVNILSGAALFCRREAFEQVGGFDERIFLYHEDDDLCLRLRQAGWTLRLEHRAKVAHRGGKSSGGSLKGTWIKAFSIAQSRLYVERKHQIPFAGLRALGRVAAKMLSPLNLASRRKRTQALAYLRGTMAFRADTYGQHKDQ